MVFQVEHNYFTVHWSPVGVSSEGGQFGLRFAGSALTAQADIDAAAAQVKTWWTNAATNLQPNYNLNTVKCARIGPDGKYVPGATVWQGNVVQPALAGGTGGIQFPLQCAAVATLRTAFASGLAHSGRIYLPPLAGLLSSSQQWTQSMVNASNAQLGTMLSNLSGGPLGTLTIMSFGNAAVPIGPAHQVLSCTMDGRPDVQRRRAAQITPTVGTAALIA